MRLVSTSSCQPGMRLGKGIYNEDGIILLGRLVELTQPLISRLQQLGVDYVYIEDKDTEDVVVSEMISDETRRKALAEIKSNFGRYMEESSKAKFSRGQFMGQAFNSVMKMIIDDLTSNKGALIMLMDMNVLNNYIYQHSLNVSIYTTMLGMAHGYSKDEIMTLGLGSLLHDIGKMKINLNLLRKEGPLSPSEYDEVKKHTEHGFQMLKDEPNIPLLVAHCAFQHHERLDGSGYPRGIKGDEIHEYAKWIAIADSYDAMTTHRPHRLAMLPHQAMEMLFTGAGTLYDQKKVALFRDNVAIYPLGITVTLNTGEKGVVVDVNPSAPQRPIVRIISDADGQRPSQLYEVDLSKKLTLMIERVHT
jgi:HD-GYP domain-containing protein (c-di-GMP phosphodiesterase class II)